MKVRSGFVSNSSTSSFVIYGTELTSDMRESLEAKHGEDCEVYEVLEDEGIQYYSETEYGTIVGVSFTSIGEDETPRQFKAKVKAQLEEVFGCPVGDCELMMSGEYVC